MLPQIFICKIIKVVDGDTVDVELDLGFHIFINHRMRLASIDAPEMKEGVPGIAAKLHLMRYAGQKLIVASEKTDKYGRYLGTFYTELNGKSINQELIDLGLAKKYEVKPHAD
jgi:micrococcal nuclease